MSEVYEQHRDLEHVRGLLGHTRIEMKQLYAEIRRCAQIRRGVLLSFAKTSPGGKWLICRP